MPRMGMTAKFVRSAGSAEKTALKIRLKKDDQVKVISRPRQRQDRPGAFRRPRGVEPCWWKASR